MLQGGKIKMLLFVDRYSLAVYIIHHILIFIYLDYVPGSQQIMAMHFVAMPLLMFIIITPLSLVIAYGISYLPGSKYIIGVKR